MDFFDINDLVPDVLPFVRGCTNHTIRENIRLAAIDFCQRTNFSQQFICDLDIVEGEAVVPIPCPSTNVELLYVLSVSLKQQGPLAEANRGHRGLVKARPRHNYRLDNYGTPAPWPANWSIVRKTGILLAPIPKEDHLEEIDILASFQPTRNANKIDRLLVDDHRQALKNGTLYRLLNMVSEEWGNPVQARTHDKDYEIELSRTKVEVERDFGLAPTFAQPSPLA